MSQLAADLLSRGAATLVGLFLVVSTTISLMRTVVIPRALRSLISDTVARIVTGSFIAISRLRRTYSKRDGVLAWAGPTTIIAQLLTWLLLYLVAYGLLIYGVSGLGLGAAVRQAGSSLFTLGFAAVDTESQTIIDFIAAATGPIVIAMLIGFLPTIYSSYLEREVDVTMLSVTGGEPAWGPELLCRHAVAGNLVALDRNFENWSRWAATLRMTHVTYPVLVWVRSARASRHYLVALLAVMDAAALQVSLNRSLPRHHAYGLLLQGSQALDVLYVFLFARRPWRTAVPFLSRFLGGPRPGPSDQMSAGGRRTLATQMAASLDSSNGLDGDAVRALARGEDHVVTLTRADFDRAVDLLTRAGFPIEVDLDTAWDEFRAARSRYEFAALSIAEVLDATPAPWSGSRPVDTPTAWPTLVVDVVPLVSPDRRATLTDEPPSHPPTPPASPGPVERDDTDAG